MDYKNVKIAPSTTRSNISPGPENAVKQIEPENNPTLRINSDNTAGQDMPEVMRPREGSKYRYIRTLGRGGMKVVLEVHDNDTMRNVAMALLPDISTRSQLELGQFLREARLTAGLEHPNIVPVHDIGMDSSGSPYFTMKLLRGRTLAVLLKKLADNDPEYVPLYKFDQLLRIFLRICNAIAFAHSKGVLHLDLKPENVQIGDYGEVLVLDWGLARKITPNQSAGPKINTKTRVMKRLNTGNGESQINGTPGYMAPEQIRGSKNACSEQTDVYALGAILYAMITYMNPLQNGEVDKMLQDTLSGNIQRPSLRVKDREIPYGIEAVVLKAMSLDPADRYPSVKALRDEVLNFIDGYATEAENAGPLKKTLLYMRRHVRSMITGAVILLLTVLLAFFSWREAHRTISLWIPMLTVNFQKPGFPMDSCSFRDHDFKELSQVWPLAEAEGLRPQPKQWLVFREPFQENVRISFYLTYDRESMKKMEFALIPVVSAGKVLSARSPMVTCQLIGAPQWIAEVLESRDRVAPKIIASAPLRSLREKDISVTIEHENGYISLIVDRKNILKVPSFRLLGNGALLVAFRGDMPHSKIRNLEIARLAPPENATALLAGDTLLEERLYEQAVRRYLQVDDNRPGSKLAETALQKAYLAAFKLNQPDLRNEFLLDIKKRLAARYPDFNMSHLLTADACAAWRDRNYVLALQLMYKVFEYDPYTKVVQFILEMPHEPLPEEIQPILIKLIRRTRGLVSLDLSNYGLKSLHGIAGMPLISLNCSRNRLTSLRDLKGMPLESLDCSNNRIKSLQELKGMPLRYLDYSGNPVKSAKLRGK